MTEKIDRIKELTFLLKKASEAYYNTGNPIMTDSEFDSLLEELKQLENETGVVLSGSPTHNVGAKVLTELKKVKHNHPMLSLDKCHSVEEIIKFNKENKFLVAMPKLDGLTVTIKYQDGKLVSAETRGDGYIGCDITEHIKHFKNVPLFIDTKGTYIVDGEAIISNEDFEEINRIRISNGEEKFELSRSVASGTLNNLDTSVVADRKLQFIVWDVIEDQYKHNNLLSINLSNAEMLGFDVIDMIGIITIMQMDEMVIQRVIDKLKENANIKGFPIDGIVFKYDDIEYGKSLGATEHHFKNAIAYKFADDSVESTLKDIEWSVGKTGQITPVAIFDPINIEGSMVERASLHNLSIMYELYNQSWHSGLKVHVKKSNQIIPQIVSVKEGGDSKAKRLDYPRICPCCKGETNVKEINNTKTLYCLNPDCKGKLLCKLKHFVSKDAMNIDGLSEAKLQTLMDKGFIENYIDIYELYDKFGASGDVAKLEGFGQKSAQNLFDAIEKSKNTTLDRFIYSLSIPMIGKTASKTISKFFNGDFVEFFYALENCVEHSDNISIEDFERFNWLEIDGLGQAMVCSIIDFIKDSRNIEMIWELSTYLDFQKPEENQGSKFSGMTFVITGKLYKFENRDKAKEFIESNGGKVSSAVSKKTNYLINNDILSTSGKNKTAKKFNIPIITEEEMLLMAKQ